MAYPTLSSYNVTNDITMLFVYANDVTSGVFMPLVMFAFFMIVLMASFFAQRRFGGNNDFAVSFAVAGFLTAGFSYILLIKDGLINPLYSVVATVIAIIGMIWLFFTSKE